jgi:hypothetical protein
MALPRCSTKIPHKQFQGTSVTLYHWALANGFYTPLIQREKKWGMCGNSRFRKSLEGIRWMIWKDLDLCHGVFHDGFLVAPKEWPKKSREAWGLKEPPSPYEVACAILVEPQKGFWQLAKGADPVAMSVTYWWLAGLHGEAISNLLGGRRSLMSGGFDVLMSQFIRHAMTKKRFAVWALGTDLTPACTSRHVARAALALMRGTPMRRAGGHNGGSSYEDKAALKKLLGHPYLVGQLRNGVRFAPIDRPLYKDGIVWSDLAAKIEWLCQNMSGGKRVLGARKILAQYPEQHPAWLRMTHV